MNENMKGREIINHINRAKMPDLEEVRAMCHTQEQNVPHRRSIGGLHLTTAAAIVFASLIFVSAAYAVFHLGSFDRLREIVGDERADELQPIGYDITTGQFATGIGFGGELVAVGITTNVIDLYLTIEDTLYNRLDEHFEIFAYVRQSAASLAGAPFTDIIDRTDCGIVTLRSRVMFTEPITASTLTFNLRYIRHTYRYENFVVDFDLSTLTEQEPAGWLWDTPILQPHLHDIRAIPPAGFLDSGDIRISSMGIIDGRLHVQEQYDLIALWRWTQNKFDLINPYGEIVQPIYGSHYNTASVSFGIDEYGELDDERGYTFYNDRGYNYVVTFPFRENIFEVDLERLAEYSLVAYFNTNDVAAVHWSVRFDVEIPYAAELVVCELDVLLACSIITEVRVSPLTVIISGRPSYETEIYRGLGIGAEVRLHLNDGTAIDVLRRQVQVESETRVFVEFMKIDTDFLDLDTVVAIEIADEIIPLR